MKIPNPKVRIMSSFLPLALVPLSLWFNLLSGQSDVQPPEKLTNSMQQGITDLQQGNYVAAQREFF